MAIATLLAVSGCRREALSVRLQVDREAPLAEYVFPQGVSAVIVPALEVRPGARHRGAREEEGGASSWVECRVFLRGARPGVLPLVLDLDSAAHAEGRAALVSLDRRELLPLRLAPGRHPVRLDLPAGGPGTLVVSADLRQEPRDQPMVSIADVALGAAAGYDAEPASSRREPGLRQRGPGALRVAFTLPRDAELRAALVAEAGSSAPVDVRIGFASDDGPERQLWQAALHRGGGSPREIALRLPGPAGEPALLSFHVDGPGGAAVRWIEPRVLGRGPSTSSLPAPLSPEERARGSALRSALAGANVIVVLLDAASALHVGAYGYARPTTPGLDRLAREGVLFERAYTPAPFTVGAVSSLWTSQYPDQHHHGVRHDAPLPLERLTLAEALQARGVRTAGFVGNPSAGRPFGLDQGFAEFHSIYEVDGGAFVRRAEAFRAPLERFLDSARSGRFFAFVHHLQPHFPYDPPPPFDHAFGPDRPLPRSARTDDAWLRRLNAGEARLSPEEQAHLVRLYDGNLAYVDREVEWLRRALEARGLLERTVLIVASDHGEALFERGFVTHGGLLDEASLRVPLVVRFPRAAGLAGRRVRGLVDLLDVAPTVAEVFGLEPGHAALRSFEGRSLLSVVAGAPARPAVLARTMQERPTFALVEGRYKAQWSLRRGSLTLHDLEADPGEAEDLAARLPVRAEAMRQQIGRFLRDLRREPAAPVEESLTSAEEQMLRALGYAR